MVVSLVFSLSTFSYASCTSKSDALELISPSGDAISVTHTEKSDGTVLFYEYHNGVLTQIVRTFPGCGYYDFINLSEASRSTESFWTRVELDVPSSSNTIQNKGNSIVPMSLEDQYQVNRYVGNMHYYNQALGTTYSITCRVYENYIPQHTITVTGVWGTVATVVASIVALFGLMAAVAQLTVDALVMNSLVEISADGFVQVVNSIDSFQLSASSTEQRIIGTCTSHTGKPTGDLGLASINRIATNQPKYPGEAIYYGYTTSAWGSPMLGSQMFYKVFGVAYTPTSWTY